MQAWQDFDFKKQDEDEDIDHGDDYCHDYQNGYYDDHDYYRDSSDDYLIVWKYFDYYDGGCYDDYSEYSYYGHSDDY